jgi:hypothetical protein
VCARSVLGLPGSWQDAEPIEQGIGWSDGELRRGQSFVVARGVVVCPEEPLKVSMKVRMLPESLALTHWGRWRRSEARRTPAS